jgi:hypothetical protein
MCSRPVVTLFISGVMRQSGHELREEYPSALRYLREPRPVVGSVQVRITEEYPLSVSTPLRLLIEGPD